MAVVLVARPQHKLLNSHQIYHLNVKVPSVNSGWEQRGFKLVVGDVLKLIYCLSVVGPTSIHIDVLVEWVNSG